MAGLLALVAACGSGQAETTVPPAAETAAPSPAEGPAAPAVTLELDDGSTFVSAEAVRPTLYVFWAEW